MLGIVIVPDGETMPWKNTLSMANSYVPFYSSDSTQAIRDGNVAAPSRRTSPIGSKEKRPVGIGAAKRAGVRKLRKPKLPQALGTPFLLVLLVIAGAHTADGTLL